MRISRPALILVLFAGITTGALVARDQWKGTITKEGGVTVVKNPKEPISKDPALSLKQDFALGGPDATGDSAFNQIRTAAIGDDGSIYVLDGKESHVKIFDKSGKYLKTFGRKGQGPGELNLPLSISINRIEGELLIQDVSRRLSFFSLDGTFLRAQPLNIWGLRARLDSKGNIVVQEAGLDPKDPHYVTKKFDPGLKLLAEFGRSPAPGPQAFNPLMALSDWVIDDRDNIVYGYPVIYEIDVLGSENQIVRRILKEYDPVEISDAEKENWRKATASEGTKLVFERNHSAFRSFFLSDLGHIIVQTWEKAKDGKTVHDIFDAEGRFLSRIALALNGIEIRNGKYYALEEDADGYQLLKRYSVEWKVK